MFASQIDPDVVKQLPIWKNKELWGNVGAKVRAYLMGDLIEQVPVPGGADKDIVEMYEVDSLPNTKLSHQVTVREGDLYSCDCQRWRTLELKCSHIYAVDIYRKLMATIGDRDILDVEK